MNVCEYVYIMCECTYVSMTVCMCGCMSVSVCMCEYMSVYLKVYVSEYECV